MDSVLRPRLHLWQAACVIAALITAPWFFYSASQAQTSLPPPAKKSGVPQGPGSRPIPDKPNLGAVGDRINSNTIAIVSGNINATYLTIAYDLSAVLDDGDNFRVLPIIGKGGGQNIRDVRFLKGVDLG